MSAVMDHLTLESCTVDLRRRLVRRAEGTLRISPKEAALLAYLAAHPGRTISREELLREVWSYRDGVMSRTPDTTIRTLRAKIETDRGAPRHIITDAGGGYRYEPPIVLPEPPTFVPPEAAARPPQPVGHADPQPLGPAAQPAAPGLVGRQAELADVEARLQSGARVVTLLGVPGVGKSHLARVVAARATARHPDRAGALVCDLSSCDTLDEAFHTILQTVSPDEDDSPSPQSVTRLLSELGPALLVLDNADLVIGGLAQALGQWRNPPPGLQILITARERLRLQGETCVRVEPLPPRDAVELLQQRVRDAGVTVDAETSASITELAQRLDGIPLALQLAAARIPTLGARGVLDRLTRGFSFLGEELRDAPNRHATLNDAIQISWDLLPLWARDAWMQSSVFVGGFDLAAAHAVIDLSRHADAPPVDQALAQLAERCVLRRTTADDLRYATYESLRSFARRRLDLGDRAEGARRRHARWFMGRAAEATGVEHADPRPAWWALDVPHQPDLQPERGNLLAALATCTRLATDADAAQLALALLSGALAMPISSRLDLLEPLRASVSRIPAAWRGRITLLFGVLEASIGQVAAARADLTAATPLAASVSDAATASDALSALAHLELTLGRADAAADAFARAGALIDPARDVVRAAHLRRGAGQVQLVRLQAGDPSGRADRAEDHLTQALTMFRRARHPGGQCATLRHLSALYRVTGRGAQARTCADDAISLAADAGLPALQALAGLDLARLALQEGRPAEARPRLASSMQHLRALGMRTAQVEVALDLARTHLAEGHASVALEVLDHDASVPDDPELEALRGREALVRGVAEALLDHPVVAVACLTDAARALTAGGDDDHRVLALAWTAAVHLVLLRPDAADEALRAATDVPRATPAALRALAVVSALAERAATPGARASREVDVALADLAAATRPGAPGAAEPLAGLLGTFAGRVDGAGG
jgi:predicted ATPase/DNA-binding winged helix-turn-helix (wHTH) protein